MIEWDILASQEAKLYYSLKNTGLLLQSIIGMNIRQPD